MKRSATFLSFIFLTVSSLAQKRSTIDSIKRLITTAKFDTVKALLYNHLGQLYSHTHPDSDLLFQEHAMNLLRSINITKDLIKTIQANPTFTLNAVIPHHPKCEAMVYNSEGIAFYNEGIYPKALSCYILALKINEQLHDRLRQVENLNNIANVYDTEGDYRQAIEIELRNLSIAQTEHSKRLMAFALTDLGDFYMDMKNCDSAFFYEQQAYQLTLQIKNTYLLGGAALGLGVIYLERNRPYTAIIYFHKAIICQKMADDIVSLSRTQLQIAKAFKQMHMPDSSIYYARKAMGIAVKGHFINEQFSASEFLTSYFKEHLQLDSAFYYQGIALINRDSLFNQEESKRIMQIGLSEQERESEAAIKAVSDHSTIRFYKMMIIVVFLVVVAVIFWLSNLKNIKAKRLLQKQKEQIKATLNELEDTQNQLVQAAKMASLGELTAGIAHEIQNPLNFVNNFSEVSAEMIAELDDELAVGDIAEARLIAVEVKQNLEKIRHHGGRADSIVRNMLEHSRISAGCKEAADLNLLVDEFLRLSYHGMRAKDKFFNAELITHFDENLHEARVVSQDIGRVLLNIFNNAFYAINQKAKTTGSDFTPAIEVKTWLQGDMAVISIKDNGIGIPENIREKIMQPFFTTKPTGEGTGLGLSLSYDIVVKGHNGKIEINSREGIGSEFLISLPV